MTKRVWFPKVLLSSLTLAACCVGSQAYAGSVLGKVTQVRIDQDGRGIITFDTPVSSVAGCSHPAFNNALSFNASGAGGRAILAVALMAKSTGTPVNAIGSGVCAIYGGGNVEDWGYGIIMQ